MMNKLAFRSAFRDTLPVMAGYLFLGFGFGILMFQNGYGVLWSFSMSLFIFAGSMQYLTVGLLATGAGLLTVALTTVLVNARHLFYGISMVNAYKGAGKKKAYMIFALTDETYSLVSRDHIPTGTDKHNYCFLVSILNHSYWVTGTLLGSLLGSLLPINYEGIEFALTALFVTIYVDQWMRTKKHLPALLGLGATLLCLLIFGKDIFLIPSMIIITLSLVGMNNKQGGVLDE